MAVVADINCTEPMETPTGALFNVKDEEFTMVGFVEKPTKDSLDNVTLTMFPFKFDSDIENGVLIDTEGVTTFVLVYQIGADIDRFPLIVIST